MMTNIVVGTNPDRERYVQHFMNGVPSFFRDYIYVASTWNMELGAIQDGMNRFSRFAFLQDTMKVHNWIMFMEALNRHHTSYIIPRPSCYAMVYDSSTAARAMASVGMPGQDKEAAIMGETLFCDQYAWFAEGQFLEGTLPVLYPEMTDGEALAAHRYFYLNGESAKARLHLRSACGTLSKYKGVYR